MNDTYDWSGFYTALGELGPRVLVGIDDGLREVITIIATTEDMFWSDGLSDPLADGAAAGDLRGGVLATLELWWENVFEALLGSFGIELDFRTVTIDTDSPLIDDLVVAATPGDAGGTDQD